jgi:hypothetical protein
MMASFAPGCLSSVLLWSSPGHGFHTYHWTVLRARQIASFADRNHADGVRAAGLRGLGLTRRGWCRMILCLGLTVLPRLLRYARRRPWQDGNALHSCW